MAIFKCKMCGGNLETAEGVTVTECEYCGTHQTVPRSMDDNMQSLCNRANLLRIKGEFDKAAQIYEKIVQLDNTQSEAYWGLILCKYGIEYVDDPATLKKIPTCHRASYESIIADEDYKSALANADTQQRVVYENQAREIDRIQRDILLLVQKEEKYDVFICYKETDANGNRTQDSVIANDIYYQLTNEGFKVFYAAITLEGKLGSAYEPIIFAALNSAKVMLAIGTNPEYFNAVWVKNEWSRFLKIIQKDRSKLLIPCYRDMSAYELPEEFAHLQAQDMSKIGFLNDVVRGIKRVIVKEIPNTAPTVSVAETNYNNNGVNVDAFFVRANFLLEAGDFAGATNIFDRALDQDPTNGKAYFGKLLASLKLKSIEEFKNTDKRIDKDKNYILALNSADEATKKMILDKAEENKMLAKKQKWKFLSIYSLSIFSLVFTLLAATVVGDEETCEPMLFWAIGAVTVAIALLIWFYRDFFIKKDAKILSKSLKKNNIIIIVLISLQTFISVCILLGGSTYQTDISFSRFVACLILINAVAITFHLITMCKRGKKRIIVGLILSAFSITLVCGMVNAIFIDPYVYLEYSDTVEIKGSRIRLSGDIELPSEYKGKPVTVIDSYAFVDCEDIRSVVIPDSVTDIRNNAFADCNSLTNINIPSSVESIGVDAFSGCDNLREATFSHKYWTSKYWSNGKTKEFDIYLSSLSSETVAKYLTQVYNTYSWTRKD